MAGRILGRLRARSSPGPLLRYEAQGPVAVVRLRCPEGRCGTEHGYAWIAACAGHGFRCVACGAAFSAWLGEVAALAVEGAAIVRRYRLEARGLGGELAAFAFTDASGARFAPAPGSGVLLVHDARGVLREVVDRAAGTRIHLVARQACFVATAVYGPGAPELAVLRRFRDRSLGRHPWGRLLVRAYYRNGMGLARFLVGRPRCIRLVRQALGLVVAMLRTRERP